MSTRALDRAFDLPSTSAAPGVVEALVPSRRVSGSVAERAQALQRVANIAGIGAVAVVAAGFLAGLALTGSVLEGIAAAAYAFVFLGTPALAVAGDAGTAAQQALELDDRLDLSFVSADGLVFFSDDGVFVERRGGFKPYKLYSEVVFERRRLILRGPEDRYALEIAVPSGWNDADTARVRRKLDAAHGLTAAL